MSAMLDRITTRYRTAFMIAGLIALVPSLLAYGKFIQLFYDAFGPWWTIGVGFCNVTALVGFGCLLDDLGPRKSLREPGPQVPPDRR